MNSAGNIKVRSKIRSPEISVIIPFHGKVQDLTKCIAGLKHQNFNFKFEIIVVESGNDPGVGYLINSIDNAALVTSSYLMYPGKARNLGVTYSTSKFLAFIDADSIPEEDWLSEIYFSLKKGNDNVIGPVINLHPFHPIATVDNLFLFIDFQKHRSSRNVDHFTGCSLGMTKDLFYKAGEFPENIKIGEDTKFSESALKKGKIYFNKKMIVRHSGRKNYSDFKKHHWSFGFYRGYFNHKILPKESKFRRNYFYPVLLGSRRLLYITIRTLQWNPVGLLRVIFYSPFLILGISAWIDGFRKGNQKYLSEINFQSTNIPLENSLKETE